MNNSRNALSFDLTCPIAKEWWNFNALRIVRRNVLWDTLPDEIWVHIFSFLDIPSLFPCMQLSHQLHLATHTPSLWKQRCKERFQVEDELQEWEGFEDYKQVYKVMLHFGHLRGLWRMVSVRGGLLHISGKGSSLSGCALTLGLRGDEEYVPAVHIKLLPSIACEVHVSSVNPFYHQALRHFILLRQQLSPEMMGDIGWKPGNISNEQKDTLIVSPWTKAFIPALYHPPHPRTTPVKNELSHLCGLWKGIYGGHGWEVLSVIIEQDRLIGMKMIGDPNVPAGVPSWWIDYSPDEEITLPKATKNEVNEHLNIHATPAKRALVFEGQGRIAEEGYINPEWVRGRLSVWNKDSISFTWRDGGSFGIQYYPVKEPTFWS